MRTGGLPCRSLGCARAFQVVDQRSMGSLNEASAARSDHEIGAHGYHHVRLPDERSMMSFMRPAKKREGG